MFSGTAIGFDPNSSPSISEIHTRRVFFDLRPANDEYVRCFVTQDERDPLLINVLAIWNLKELPAKGTPQYGQRAFGDHKPIHSVCIF